MLNDRGRGLGAWFVWRDSKSVQTMNVKEKRWSRRWWWCFDYYDDQWRWHAFRNKNRSTNETLFFSSSSFFFFLFSFVTLFLIQCFSSQLPLLFLPPIHRVTLTVSFRPSPPSSSYFRFRWYFRLSWGTEARPQLQQATTPTQLSVRDR